VKALVQQAALASGPRVASRWVAVHVRRVLRDRFRASGTRVRRVRRVAPRRIGRRAGKGLPGSGGRVVMLGSGRRAGWKVVASVENARPAASKARVIAANAPLAGLKARVIAANAPLAGLKAQAIAANARPAASKAQAIAANARPADLKAQAIAANARPAASKAQATEANARPAASKARVIAANAHHVDLKARVIAASAHLAASKARVIAVNARPADLKARVIAVNAPRAATTANAARSADRAQAQAVHRKTHRVANARRGANATHPIGPVSAATVVLPKTIAEATADRVPIARRAVSKASAARPNVANAALRNP
jgi:hypothetical protein